MMDVMAAASATVKLGSAVMAAAAALTVSAMAIPTTGGLGACGAEASRGRGIRGRAAAAEVSDGVLVDMCRPENLEWCCWL